MSGFYRGTTHDQDARYANKQKKLLADMKFPKVLATKIDLKKVNMDVMRPWIVERVYELLGVEDEVVPEYVFEMLEESNEPDGKTMQVNLTGFLEDKTAKFMNELWKLLISAQESIGGIPAMLLEKKKQEILKKKEEEQKIQEELRRISERNAQERQKIRKEEKVSDEPRKSRFDDRREAPSRSERRSRSRSVSRLRHPKKKERNTSRDRSRSRSVERRRRRDRSISSADSRSSSLYESSRRSRRRSRTRSRSPPRRRRRSRSPSVSRRRRTRTHDRQRSRSSSRRRPSLEPPTRDVSRDEQPADTKPRSLLSMSQREIEELKGSDPAAYEKLLRDKLKQSLVK